MWRSGGRLSCCLLLLLAACSLAACSERDVDSEIAGVFAGVELPPPGRDPAGLLDDDAAALVQAAAVLELAAPSDFDSRLVADAFIGSLHDAALRRLEPSVASTSLGGLDVSGLSRSERLALAREAEAVIREISERYALATAEAAVDRQIQAEAQLNVIRRDLQRSLRAPASLPEDPLALAPEPSLRRAHEALEPLRRQLSEHAARFDTPSTREALRIVEQRSRRLERILASPEYRQFQAGRADLYSGLDKDVWKACAGDRPARAAAEVQRLQRVAAEVSPELREALLSSRRIRGPPRGELSETIFSSIRDYDIRVRDWSYAEARLRALSDELRGLSSTELPADSPLRSTDWRRASLTLVPGEDLHQFKRFLDLATAEPLSDTAPAPTLDRRGHRESWRAAIEAELERRAGSGSAADAEAAPGVRNVVATNARHRGVPLSPRGEQRLAAVLSERFAHPSHVPLACREDLRSIVAGTAQRYEQRLDALARDLSTFNNRLASSRNPVEPRLMAKHGKLRAQVRVMAESLEGYLDRAESQGLLERTPESRLRHQARLLLTRPRGPPVSPPPVASPEPQRLVLATDAAVEGSMARAEVLSNELRQEIAHLETAPSLHGRTPGRRIVRAEQLRARTVAWTRLEIRRTESRLPPRYADWQGLVGEDGRPYDYHADVKSLRSSRAVGGGIHFGETATFLPGAHGPFLLYYSRAGRELRLESPGGEHYVLGDVEAEVLKALYGFVTAGRNSAISLGWAGIRESRIASPADPRRREDRPILLDPYFVDTPVGQDLILAEMVPLRLGEPALPNGEANPISAAFGQARRAFLEERSARFREIFTGVEPFAREQGHDWARRMKDTLIFSPFLQALLISASKTEAETRLLGLMPYLAAGEPLPREPEERAVAEDLRRAFALFDDLPEDPSAALLMLVDEVVLRLLDEGRCDRAVLELWAALHLAAEPDPGATPRRLLADFTEDLLSPRSPAILMDDRATVSLEGPRIVLSADLTYRFAAHKVDVDEEEISLHQGPAGGGELEAVPEMSRIATQALPELARRYPPLDRVMGYARLAAFLRWATAPESQVEVDLSELAEVAVHHPDRFPTADAIRDEGQIP